MLHRDSRLVAKYQNVLYSTPNQAAHLLSHLLARLYNVAHLFFFVVHFDSLLFPPILDRVSVLATFEPLTNSLSRSQIRIRTPPYEENGRDSL